MLRLRASFKENILFWLLWSEGEREKGMEGWSYRARNRQFTDTGDKRQRKPRVKSWEQKVKQGPGKTPPEDNVPEGNIARMVR